MLQVSENKNYLNKSFVKKDQVLFIYKTTNLINGKIYIGQHIQNNPNYLGSGSYFRRALKKHGKQNFKREILCRCSNLKELDEKETYYIKKHNSTNAKIGYNCVEGPFDPHKMKTVIGYARSHREGILQFINSEKGKLRMKTHSKFMKQIHKTKEYQDKQRGALKKYNTDEVRKKRSETVKKFRTTEAWKEVEKKRLEGIKKFNLDKKRLAKKTESYRKYINSPEGKIASKLQSDKMIAARKKLDNYKRVTIKQFSLSGKFINVYNSVVTAAKANNLNSISIWNYKKNIGNIAVGFIWKDSSCQFFNNSKINVLKNSLINKKEPCIKYSKIIINPKTKEIYHGMKDAQKQLKLSYNQLKYLIRCKKINAFLK